MTVLITGGAGFIGSHLIEALIESNVQIIVLDDLSSGSHNLKLLKKFKNVNIRKGDITDDQLLNELVAECSEIYHLAAMNRAPRSIENPLYSNKINITGTLKILEAARKFDVDRMVFASSSSVYGRSKIFPRRENGETLPAHPYALGKLASEYYCDIYYQLYGIKVKKLRYFAVYGPRQSPTIKYAAVIPIFTMNVIAGKKNTIFGDGTQTRNFTFVKDTVKATIEAMNTDKATGKIINVASPREVSLLDLLEILAQITGEKVDVQYEEWRKGDAKRAVPDLTLAGEILGMNKCIQIEEGLKEVFSWYKENPTFFQ
ncbi:MAG: GDP-mannose 4,6-dehydratase [Promethearchaeota archaeon]|jgi:UDP-glucose 4-epimerase